MPLISGKVLDIVPSSTGTFISWPSFVILALVWPNLSGCISQKEPCIHSSSLKLTGVYVVIFSLTHTHGYKLQQAKGQQGFPSLKTKKLTLKWSVAKWKDKTAKSSPQHISDHLM